VHVALTPEGVAAFEAMAASHEAMLDDLLAGLGPEDMDALRDILRRALPKEGE
jgi:DNA-binding MarR family transcriptional regulator